jgi:Ca2+-binding EF-hand superfamily protein
MHQEVFMKRLFLASVAVVAISGLAFAAGSAPPDAAGHPMGGMRGMGPMGMPGQHHHEMLSALIAHFDANGDGSITRAEIDAGIAKDFRNADTDHNGKLSNVELKAYMEARHAEMAAKWHGDDAKGDQPKDDQDDHDGHAMGSQHMDPVKHLDWNLDGSLSLDEFGAPIRLVAMRLDRDGSGTITATDLLGHEGGPSMGH